MQVVINLDTIEKQRVWLALWDDNYGLADWLKDHSEKSYSPPAAKAFLRDKSHQHIAMILEDIHPFKAWDIICDAVGS